MRYSRITNDQGRYFRSLAPGEMLGRLGMKGYIGVAAIAEKDDIERANTTIEELNENAVSEEEKREVLPEDKEIAAGLMILYYSDEKELSIEWIYVDEDFRGLEVGASLVLIACETARDRKMTYVSARVLENVPDPKTQMLISEYLTLLGFRWQTEIPGDYEITAGDLKKESFVKKAMGSFEAAGGFGSLEELTDLEWKRLINSMAPHDRDILLHVSMEKGLYDPKLSRLKMVKGSLPTGYILIQRVGKVLYPIGIWTRTGNQKEKLMLIFSAAAQIEKRVEDGDIIKLINRSGEAAGFMAALKLHLPQLPAFSMKIEPAEYIDSFNTEELSEPEGNLFYPDTPDDGYELIETQMYTDL